MLASFEGGKVTPRLFQWQNRDYKIKEVSLAYQENNGSSVDYYFSVETDNSNIFKLRYNDRKMIWTILEIWND